MCTQMKTFAYYKVDLSRTRSWEEWKFSEGLWNSNGWLLGVLTEWCKNIVGKSRSCLYFSGLQALIKSVHTPFFASHHHLCIS